MSFSHRRIDLDHDFQYDEAYFDNHYSSSLYRRYVTVRNRFIHDEVTKYASSGRFLEIGFGDDNLIQFFDDDFDVFGIDVSNVAVESVTGKYDPRRFANCDVAREPIPFDGNFDVICTVNTVEHLADPEFALQNIAGSLRERGVLAVYLPTESNVLSRTLYKFRYDVEEHIFRPSVASLKCLLRGVGLDEREAYAAGLIPLKISHEWILESLNLYLGIWQKEEREG